MGDCIAHPSTSSTIMLVRTLCMLSRTLPLTVMWLARWSLLYARSRLYLSTVDTLLEVKLLYWRFLLTPVLFSHTWGSHPHYFHALLSWRVLLFIRLLGIGSSLFMCIMSAYLALFFHRGRPGPGWLINCYLPFCALGTPFVNFWFFVPLCCRLVTED